MHMKFLITSNIMNCVLQDLKQNFLRGCSVIDLRIEKNSGKELFTKLYEL